MDEFKTSEPSKTSVTMTVSSNASDLFCKQELVTFDGQGLSASENAIIMPLTDPGVSTLRYQSNMWKCCYKCLLEVSSFTVLLTLIYSNVSVPFYELCVLCV